MIDPGAQYVIEMLGRTLAERDQQIAQLAREVGHLTQRITQLEKDETED